MVDPDSNDDGWVMVGGCEERPIRSNIPRRRLCNDSGFRCNSNARGLTSNLSLLDSGVALPTAKVSTALALAVLPQSSQPLSPRQPENQMVDCLRPTGSKSANATATSTWEIVESRHSDPRNVLATLPASDPAAEFVHVAPTGLTLVRQLARRRPELARAALWMTFGLLVLGELATTAWWLYDLGLFGCIVVSVFPAIIFSLALCVLTAEQVFASTVSLFFAVLPALPAYSAVLLVVPYPSPDASHNGPVDLAGSSENMIANDVKVNSPACSEALHWPALIAMAILYLSSVILPTLRTEMRSPGPRAVMAQRFLEEAQKVARSFCVLSAWLYAAVSMHMAARYLLQPEGTSSFRWWGGALASPLAGERGFVLGLHAVGIACAEMRVVLAKALGEEMLPMLLGARRARALTVRALVARHGRNLLRRINTFRRYAPPQWTVACIVAVRRTAPVLLPVLAIISQLSRLGVHGQLHLAALLGLALLALVAAVAACELRALPVAPLQLLPLLLPTGVAPLSRRLLGYGLTTLARVAGARGRFDALRSRMRPS